MSTLLNKANQLLAEKTNNLLPNTIKVNHTVFGVTGTFTSDGTAEAADIINGEIVYVNGEKIIGTMNNCGSLNITPDLVGNTYPAGYYNGITVNAVNVPALEPNLSASNILSGVNIFGVIGDSNIQNTALGSEVAVSASELPRGKQAYVNGQRINGTAYGFGVGYDYEIKGFGLGQTNINIATIEDPSSFTVESMEFGSPAYFSNTGKVTFDITKSELVNVFNITSDKLVNGYNLFGVVGNAVASVTQEKVIAPSTSIQNIVPDEGYTGLSKVTINAVNSSIDPNITPQNIVNGVTILGVQGTAIGANLTTLEVLANGTYTPPAGYDGFSQVDVMVPGTSSNIYIQTNQPTTANGIWFNANPQAYTLHEINEYNSAVNYGANQLLVVKGFDINTKISGDMTYYFNTVLLSNADGAVNLSLRKYYGNGSSWVEIEDGFNVLTPEEAEEANSTLDNILGQPDQGDTDNLTPEEDIKANEIADDILGIE